MSAEYSHPIRRVLIGGFLLVAVVPLAFLGIKLYQLAWDQAWREVTEKHQLLAQNLAEPISIYIGGQRSSLQQLARFIEHSTPGMGSQKLTGLQQQYISGSMQALSGFRSVSLVNLNGRVLLSTYGILSESRQDVFARETCYVNTRKKDRWFLSGIKPSPFDHQPSIVLSVPVHDQNNRQMAVLMAELRVDLLEKLRAKIKFGEKGHSAIVDNSGHVVAHPNPEWMAQMRDLSAWPIVKKMTSGNTGVTEFYSPFIGANMVAGYASVAEINWGIMVPQPKPEIEAQVNSILNAQLTWGLIGLSMALVIGFVLIRWLTVPINRLCRSAIEITDNDFNGQLPEISARAPREILSMRAHFVALLDGLRDSRSQLDNLNQTLQERVDNATSELRSANRQLQVFASQDYLTKLYNRRYFESSLLQMINNSKGDIQSLALIMIDVDNFRPVNDQYGLAAGDRVLITLARLLKGLVIDEQMLARYDGDKFVILLKNDISMGEALANCIIDKVNETVFEYGGDKIRVTVSVGLYCQMGDVEYSLDGLLQNVDKVLESAKHDNKSSLHISGL